MTAVALEGNQALARLQRVDSVRLLAAVRLVDDDGQIQAPTPFHLQMARRLCASRHADDSQEAGVVIWNNWVAELDPGNGVAEVVVTEECTFAQHQAHQCDRCGGVGSVTARLRVTPVAT